MEITGIILSLVLLMYLAYRGFSVIILAPLMALLAVAFHADSRLLGFYTQVFMTGLAGFLVKYFPVFLLGAIFGKLMEVSGAAKRLAIGIVNGLGASRAILAVVLSCAILTYGGVSLFVVAFAVYPLAAALFKQANIPKRLVPGSIALGSFTFTMTAMPGTVQIQNLIPMPYFQTDAFAAPVFGLIASALILISGLIWLEQRAEKAKSKGEGYGSHRLEDMPETEQALPEMTAALLPLVLIISSNYLFSNFIFSPDALAYLQEDIFGNTEPNTVIGLWSIIAAMVLGIAACLLLNLQKITDIKDALIKGANGSLLPIFNTASEVGYGTTIAALTGFALIKESVLNLSPNNPLISEAIAVNVLAGITGSASGGLSIALEALGDQYYALALEKGIDLELMHRVASMACGGLDSLPHNGAVITLLAICGLSHRESYLDIGVTTLLIPLSTLAIMLSFSFLYI
jgi:H+/gluconate symporter-like permease